MRLRIYMSIQRGNPSRSEALAQRSERAAAGIAQHQIERAKAFGRQIVYVEPFREPRERNGCIEIIENAQRAGRFIEHQAGGIDSIRAIGRHYCYVGNGQLASNAAQCRRPVFIKRQLHALHRVQIAMLRVVGNVALEERDLMAAAGERAKQPAPQCRVTVSPGRAQCQSEDDESHDFSQ
jgi:hypothetical protein